MSCACEQKKLSAEYERMWRLAKASAQIQGITMCLYMNDDGTYNFTSDLNINKQLKEFITPY